MIPCLGVAYRSNKTTQNKIAEEGAIPLLVQQLNCPLSEEVQVEVSTLTADFIDKQKIQLFHTCRRAKDIFT